MKAVFQGMTSSWLASAHLRFWVLMVWFGEPLIAQRIMKHFHVKKYAISAIKNGFSDGMNRHLITGSALMTIMSMK